MRYAPPRVWRASPRATATRRSSTSVRQSPRWQTRPVVHRSGHLLGGWPRADSRRRWRHCSCAAAGRDYSGLPRMPAGTPATTSCKRFSPPNPRAAPRARLRYNERSAERCSRWRGDGPATLRRADDRAGVRSSRWKAIADDRNRSLAIAIHRKRSQSIAFKISDEAPSRAGSDCGNRTQSQAMGEQKPRSGLTARPCRRARGRPGSAAIRDRRVRRCSSRPRSGGRAERLGDDAPAECVVFGHGRR
jgi:hypothetical protein